MKVSNIFIICLAILLAISLCATSYPYTFSTTGNSNNINKRYPIGLVPNGSTIIVTITTPKTNNPVDAASGKR